MDLSTGPGLVAAIAETINRADLTATIPAWVRMAEAEINRQLRVRQMIARETVTTSDPYVLLPGLFLEPKSIHVETPTTSRRKLGYASPEALEDMRACVSTSGPTNYTIIGSQIEFGPSPKQSTVVELVYYKAILPLDLTTPGATNWLQAKAPDIYLYGALIHSAPYLVEDDRLQAWTGIFGAILQSMNDESEMATHSGSILRMKVRTFG